MKNNQHIKEFVFSKENYKLLFIGLGTILVGYALMSGGGTDDPTQFNGEELFSFRRITLAPIVTLAGYAIVMYAIMKKSK
ncbi:MAG: hypothetical protein ACJAUV_000799 [Flavobacteriales bacterium]|jgi:hypothetical protein